MKLRPLVVRFGALGDMIMLTALLRALAEIWGEPCDVVASRGSPHLVFAGLESVGEIHLLRSRRMPFPLSPGQWDLVQWLRQRGPSPTYVVEEREMEKVEWLLKRGRIPEGHQLTQRSLPRGDLEHAVEYMWRLARQRPPAYQAAPVRPFPQPPPLPELAVTQEEIRECRTWLGAEGWWGEPLVLLQTTSRRLKRGRWPQEKWLEAVRAVLGRLPQARILLLGAPHEVPETLELARAAEDPRVQSVAGELSPRRLFALLTQAHSCLSLDTGPAHAAAALGCPVVVLVGRADPRRNRPLAPPERVQIVTSVPEVEWPGSRAEWEAWHNVADISVAAVLAAWERLAHRSMPAAGPVPVVMKGAASHPPISPTV